MPTAKSASSRRVAWLDTTKGAMILLVVFGHDWRGLARSGIVPENLFSQVDARLYAFHMPVFFAVSGWFFLLSLDKATIGAFASRRLLRLLWPMILWTYIFLGCKVLAGSLANTPIAPEEFWIAPIPGVLHFWFLWALLVLSFAFLILKPFIHDGRVSVTTLLIVAAVIVALQFLKLPSEGARWVGSAVRNAPYFFLGMVLRQYEGPFERVTRFGFVAAAIFVVLLAAWPVVSENGFSRLGSFALTLCVLVVMAGFGSAANSGVVRLLNWLGAASMAIYLTHTIFSAATRELLFACGYDGLAMHLALGTLMGVLGPLAVLSLAKRTQSARLLGF